MGEMTCERCNDTGELLVPVAPGGGKRWKRLTGYYCSCPAGIRKQFEDVPGAVVVEVEAGHPADAFDAIFSDDELLDKGGTLIFIPDKEQPDE